MSKGTGVGYDEPDSIYHQLDRLVYKAHEARLRLIAKGKKVTSHE